MNMIPQNSKRYFDMKYSWSSKSLLDIISDLINLLKLWINIWKFLKSWKSVFLLKGKINIKKYDSIEFQKLLCYEIFKILQIYLRYLFRSHKYSEIVEISWSHGKIHFFRKKKSHEKFFSKISKIFKIFNINLGSFQIS